MEYQGNGGYLLRHLHPHHYDGAFVGGGTGNGQNGQNGQDGANGKSAYQSWLDAGNSGSESEFIESLKGADGQDGVDGNGGLSNGSWVNVSSSNLDDSAKNASVTVAGNLKLRVTATNDLLIVGRINVINTPVGNYLLINENFLQMNGINISLATNQLQQQFPLFDANGVMGIAVLQKTSNPNAITLEVNSSGSGTLFINSRIPLDFNT